MSKYQVDERDKVVLVDLNTSLTIIICTRLVGDELNNNDGREVIDVSKAYTNVGKNANALDSDEIPLQKDVSQYAETFVQYASAIAAALEKGKNVVCYCNHGRSRSPSVVAAFYVIYRGLSLNEIKLWFKEAYQKQRPETAKLSVNFPNLGRFEQILVLLQKCLANPSETVQGFNLAESVCKFSTALETPLHLAGVNSRGEKIDPTSFPPSVRPMFVPRIYQSPAKTRKALKEEVEDELGLGATCGLSKDMDSEYKTKPADPSKVKKSKAKKKRSAAKKAALRSQKEGLKTEPNENAQWLYNQCSAAKARMEYPHSTLHLSTKVLETIKHQCSQHEHGISEKEQERQLSNMLFKTVDGGKKRDIQLIFDISSRRAELCKDNGLTVETLARVDSDSANGFTEWRDMWSNMKEQGWCYKVGSGSVCSWCIVHPRHSHLNISDVMRTGKKGEDYFVSVEAVKRYAKQYLNYKGSVKTLTLPVAAAVTSEAAVVAEKKRKRFARHRDSKELLVRKMKTDYASKESDISDTCRFSVEGVSSHMDSPTWSGEDVDI
mmetsp:Transcript_12357/g.24726  ORF Transcript_12357/g.24726 Transcript_12357/m.24726 type:complete len:550 (+) Transcript_12357:177-1826(+)